MGAISLSGRALVDSMAELIGFKLGLAVSEDDLVRAVKSRGAEELWPEEMDSLYRYRSEAMEELSHTLMAAFGDADATAVRASPVTMHEFPDLLEYSDAIDHTLEHLPQLQPARGSNTLDPRPLVEEVKQRWGPKGALIALRLMQSISARVIASPWSQVRRAEYASRLELRDLFTSEQLPLPLGVFFDQRFIDYLEANISELGRMHWRQFEGLVAERLRQEGLRVELGPGRADEGVDVRAWDLEADEDAPAVLLVQCKRTKSKVDRVVVKALMTDITFEGAQRGMVATTSSWSPGARSTVESRSYPIEEANQATLATWLQNMRTPGAGPWLAGDKLPRP
ncbi:restriction endonuclease [Streptomyces botrytidirepellens]|uniref:Restriction endonuclease n=1 Tax=Streptomyces botrytidirepellens TaxID=2486417 RepID=A0A3M8VJV8_9ACTN|nr:restriction endonuclease [Streptomyces botrytidirepellens]RNG17864.1 restriction endonuclease [Streptomyces botrytidirepellens]